MPVSLVINAEMGENILNILFCLYLGITICQKYPEIRKFSEDWQPYYISGQKTEKYFK